MIFKLSSATVIALLTYSAQQVSAAAAAGILDKRTVSASSTCNRDLCLRSLIQTASAQASADCATFQQVTVSPCPTTITVNALATSPAVTTGTSTTTNTIETVFTTVTETTIISAATLTGTGTVISTSTPVTTTTVIGIATTTAPAMVTKRGELVARQQTCTPATTRTGTIPAYASPCANQGTSTVNRFASACACIGVTGTTRTLPQSTVTVTAPATTSAPAPVSTTTSTITVTNTVTVPVTTTTGTTTTPTATATTSTTTVVATTSTSTVTYTGPFNVAIVSGASTVGYLATATQAQSFVVATPGATNVPSLFNAVQQSGDSSFALSTGSQFVGYVAVLGNNAPGSGDFFVLGSLENSNPPQSPNPSGASTARFTGSPYETRVFTLQSPTTGQLSFLWTFGGTPTPLQGGYLPDFNDVVGAYYSGTKTLLSDITYTLVIPGTSD